MCASNIFTIKFTKGHTVSWFDIFLIKDNKLSQALKIWINYDYLLIFMKDLFGAMNAFSGDW